jgi:hypothetical protein
MGWSGARLVVDSNMLAVAAVLWRVYRTILGDDSMGGFDRLVLKRLRNAIYLASIDCDEFFELAVNGEKQREWARKTPFKCSAFVR